MTDLMRWMYDHYIKPNIESQPITDGEATQGFRLGVHTGATLTEDFN